MKSTRIISLLMALTLLFVLCTACGTPPTTTGATSGTTAPTTSPTTEDVFKSVKIGVSYDPTTFDPAELNIDSSYAAAFMIYEALLRDVDGVIGAGIAETWEHSADMKEWTFHLRESSFSDGTPVTAEDFKYSIMRSLDPAAAHANGQTLLNLVNASEYFNGTAQAADVGVEAVDAKTLKLTYVIPMFETEFTNFLYTPVNKAFAEAAGIEYGTASDKVMCNGAFELKEWVTDSSFTLVKNESYWDADAIQMDEVTFMIGAAGSDTAVDMMLTEQVDITYFTTMNQVKSLEDAGYTAESITNSYRCLNLNHLGSTDDMAQFMGNINFRKALNLAIDRENLCSSVLTTDLPASRLSAPSELGFAKMFNEEYPYQGWPTKADQTQAKAYLQAALDELGKTIEDVPTLVLLCYESQSSVTILSAVQDMLKQVLGLESEVSAQTIGNMIAMAFGGEYDLWLGGNGTSAPDWLVSFAYGYHSDSYAATPLLRGYTNPEFDTLYDAVANSTDYKTRKDNLFALEKFFCDNVVNIIVSWTNTYYVTGEGVTNVYFRADGNPCYTFVDVTP